MKKAKVYIVVISVKSIECMGVPNLSEPIYQDLDQTGKDLQDQTYWDIGGALSFSSFGDTYHGNNGIQFDRYVIDTGNGEVQIDVSTTPREASVEVGYKGTDGSTGNADYNLSCDESLSKKCDSVSIDDAACDGNFDDMDCDELTGTVQELVDTYNSKQNLNNGDLASGGITIAAILALGALGWAVEYFAKRKKR